MPEKSQKKTEVRVFLDGIQLKVVDDLKGIFGNTRSEVIRRLIHDWLTNNVERRKELLQFGEEAEEQGYTSPSEEG